MTKPLVQATGRRKGAVARVRLRPGNGQILVNKRPFEDSGFEVVERAFAGEADGNDLSGQL